MRRRESAGTPGTWISVSLAAGFLCCLAAILRAKDPERLGSSFRTRAPQFHATGACGMAFSPNSHKRDLFSRSRSPKLKANAGMLGRMPSSRKAVLTILSDFGREIKYSKGSIEVGRVLGEGSYGVVYLGKWKKPGGGSEEVVLKRVKYNVEDADQMAHYEHLFNAYLSKAAKGAIADFIGYFDVELEEDPKIPRGKWLVWKYEGDKTLAYYLNRSGKQIKLIDLGACADLRRGTNYVPDESILDPLYCPPEDFVLPTTSPDLSKQSSIVSMAISPLLWSRHLPDRFDTYSIGVILMQLAVPSLRSEQGLRSFNAALKRAQYDLTRWRKVQRGINKEEFRILDHNGGAGFELAKNLLRERGEKKGLFSSFTDRTPRLGVAEALSHRFLKLADETPSVEERKRYVKRKSEGKTQKKKGLFWRLFDLEAQLTMKATATQKQTEKVQKLEEEVKAGTANKRELQEAKNTLNIMQRGLNRLLKDFRLTADETKEKLKVDKAATIKIKAKRAEENVKRVAAAERKGNVKRLTVEQKVKVKSIVDQRKPFGEKVSKHKIRRTTRVEELSIENEKLKAQLKNLENKLDRDKEKDRGRKVKEKQIQAEKKHSLATPTTDPPAVSSASYPSKTDTDIEEPSTTVEIATSLLKVGIGLSGLALKIAGDIAEDLRKTAEDYLDTSAEPSSKTASNATVNTVNRQK
ncbi:hypothetical protein AAMO2058_001445200 [Amorphochlora amoebiformis]